MKISGRQNVNGSMLTNETERKEISAQNNFKRNAAELGINFPGAI